MNRRAFSLIELLVVISIVGLLAAILLPALKQARDAARASICASNLRQLGLATQMYVDDYGRYFNYFDTVTGGRLWYFGLEAPYNASAAPAARKLDLTQAKLYPYFQTLHGIEVCPSYDYRSPLWRQKFETVSYGYGYNLYGLVTNSIGKMPGEIGDPARTLCFADAAQVNTIQAPASTSNPMLEESYFIEYSPLRIPTTHFRHTGRVNALFCDGHVESLAMAAGTQDARLPSAKVGRLNVDGDTSLFW